MIESFTEDFQVVWANDTDAQRAWFHDPLHVPDPMPPLSQEVYARAMRQAMGADSVFINGYCYAAGGGLAAPNSDPAARSAAEIWFEDYLPRVRSIYEEIRGGHYAGLTAQQLAERLPDLMDQAGRAFGLTMAVVYGFMGPTFELLNFCEARLGRSGAQLATRLLQGFENESSAAGAGLARLTREATRAPAVAAALQSERFANLESVAGGAQFLASLRRFLDEYGWRPESWGVLHRPTWAEDTRVPLQLIARYLNDDAAGLTRSLESAVRSREEAEAELAKQLTPADHGRLAQLVAAARSHVAVSESRALWQLLLGGSLRVPIIELGRRMQAAGLIVEPGDVFYLTSAETAGASGAESRSDRGENWRALVERRKAELVRWQTLSPPSSVGSAQPRSGGGTGDPMMRHFDGRLEEAGAEPGLIKGNGASLGIVTGPARILHSLADAGLLQPGEILVCKTTAPPWAPLFAIAAGVVAETGGILSHSAICAREYSVPCVVGARGATAIPDGTTVTIDGNEGTVRLGE